MECNMFRSITMAAVSILLWSNILYAQDADSVEVKQPKEYVKQTFDHPQLINTQTNEVLPERTWMFRIQHRFGAIGFDESFYEDFLGLDLFANIRLGYSTAITKDLMIGVGRTKVDKIWDFEAKYALLKQTKDNKMPFSLSVYSNMGINSDEAVEADSTLFFADSTTLFVPKFAHRVNYDFEVIIARKFGNAASFQFTPTFIYRNLAEPGATNHTFALPFSGRVRIGMKSFIVFEYAYVINNRTKDFRDPISLGVEISTLGHAFKMFVSSTDQLLGQEMYTNSSYDYTDGEFLFGFNITRKFWRKKKKKK